ncbi:COP23 domain-containing protein [Lyngbya sp. CCY1209]|jgi:uncharacterized surface protein with fasciclin (FAS1) repeats|uniref:COP23 domain-containing protein n=1 Tax=Lyngbya sp. CCY1209 TaxID=2886103 RepID=UPI002D21244D|nr:COP23 domain-containing protein [Lyngbya sp. CCY1209]MEB3882045.1 fasciclin domain-containing protein [Lyngbya sp. CCY1209]
MNIINIKHLSVVLGLAVGAIAVQVVAPAWAQYYPYYSFFNPMSSYYESEEDLGLVETIAQQEQLRTFAKALREAGLSRELAGQTYTILAPTDDAFANLPPAIRDDLLQPKNRQILQEILNYHLVAGRITREQVESGEILTRQGNTVRIGGDPEAAQLMLNDANADRLPIPGPNDSVIVTIDRVLLPPGLVPLGATTSDSGTAGGGSSSGTTDNSSVTAVAEPPAVSPTQFICDRGTDNLFTTYAVTPRGRVPVVKWYSDYFSDSGYTPEQRCRAVSARFQNFYRLGWLNYITHGIVNRQNVICVANDRGMPCGGDRVLFTLKPGSDPADTVQRLFDVRTGASSPLFESEDDTGVYIDFRQFLDTTPVETGTAPAPEPEQLTTPADPTPGGGIW